MGHWKQAEGEDSGLQLEKNWVITCYDYSTRLPFDLGTIGVAVAQEVAQVIYLSGGWWFDPPDYSILHVEVFLGKKLNPKLHLMAVPLVCECVYMSS